MKAAADHPLHPTAVTALSLAESWSSEVGERRMAAGVMQWLTRARWIGKETRVAFEVPWRGRRIDLVLLHSRNRLTTLEFKLSNVTRAFEQASYNRLAAHRSFVVLGHEPSEASRLVAKDLGLGLIIVNGRVSLGQRPGREACDLALASALADAVRKRS